MPSSKRDIVSVRVEAATTSGQPSVALLNVCPLPSAEFLEPSTTGYTYVLMHHQVAAGGIGAGEVILTTPKPIRTTTDIRQAEQDIRKKYGYTRVIIVNCLLLTG